MPGALKVFMRAGELSDEIPNSTLAALHLKPLLLQPHNASSPARGAFSAMQCTPGLIVTDDAKGSSQP